MDVAERWWSFWNDELSVKSQTGFCLPSRGYCQTSVSVVQCFVPAIIRDLSGRPDMLWQGNGAVFSIIPAIRLIHDSANWAQTTELLSIDRSKYWKPSACVACFMWFPQRLHNTGLLMLLGWTFRVKIFTSGLIPHSQGSSAVLFIHQILTQNE